MRPPFDIYDARCLGTGSSGSVFVYSEEHVIKVFSDDIEGQKDFDREREIFKDLKSQPPSRYIVQFVVAWPDGLILERLCSTLRFQLRDNKQHITVDTRMCWIVEAQRALEFLHEKGIMHGDVGCHNYLVNKHGHIKLCDFAGSMRKWETTRVCYEVRGQHPEYRIGEATPKTEIFALGSTIFEIYTSRAPYLEDTDDVVMDKYNDGDFPLSELECPTVRAIVQKCWKSEYVEVSDIDVDLKNIQEKHAGTDFPLISVS